MRGITVGIAVLFIISVTLWAWQSSVKSPTAKINNRTFKLYVAKSDKDKQVGLSKYKNIDSSQGMVFRFPKANYYPFWMKEMKFSIDIIYIKDGKIVTIYKNVPLPKTNSSPLVYTSTAPADTVLEVNAGLSQKYNFKKGDKVNFSNI